MFKLGIFAVFVLFFFLLQIASAQKPPRAYAKSKCEKRIKNETMLEQCKTCVEQYSLPEYPSKSEVRSMIRACVPKKDPKEWVKGKCEENTEKQDDIEKCFQCVEDFELPQNVTRDDVQALRRTCLPQPSLKFKAKRKCVKRLRVKEEIESCKECIQAYNLPEKPSCEEVNEMKRKCILERTGRELWTEPILQEDEEEYLA